MYTFQDAIREQAQRAGIKILVVLAVVTVGLLLIAPWPKASSDPRHTFLNDEAIAWSFWNHDPGMDYTRTFVAQNHENVAYVTSINAPETADMESLVDNTKTDVAIYDGNSRLWHVYRLTED